MKKIFLTINEIKNINSELNQLKEVEIPKIIEEIKKARLFGDISENSEYHSAKKNKNIIEEKIKNLEYILSNCEIGKENIEGINFSKIKLKNIANNKIIEYEIKDEKDINNNKGFISKNSPIIKIIINKKIGDIIEIKKYNKKEKYQIIFLE